MKIYSFIILFFVLGVLFSKERTFQLKSGNKVTGEVLSIDENGSKIEIKNHITLN